MSKGRSTHCWCCLLPSSVPFPLWSLAVSCLAHAAPTVNLSDLCASMFLRPCAPLCLCQRSAPLRNAVLVLLALLARPLCEPVNTTPPSVASAISCHILREIRKSCQLVCPVTVMVNLRPWIFKPLRPFSLVCIACTSTDGRTAVSG